VHIRREQWQWLESDYHSPEKKPTRKNTKPDDIATQPSEEKGTVIHHYAIQDDQP
jgi:hypothetical protein